MIIVAQFLKHVKDGICIITGKVTAPCPDCGGRMNVHGRCRRYVRNESGQREELSLRVLYCPKCHRYHRELPDYVIPYKHLCAKIFAEAYDATKNYCVDDHTAAGLRRCPTLVTNYDTFSTLDKLRYFVRVVVNVGEWKSTSSRILSGLSMI